MTWLLAAIFTKLVAFDKTRDFMQQQTANLSESWLSLLLTKSGEKTVMPVVRNQVVLGWREDQLLLQQGDMLFERPSADSEYIEKIGEDNWLFSTRCEGVSCILVGVKDTQRKCAVGNLVLFIYLPLLAIFLLAMLAMYVAVRSGLQPLADIAKQIAATPIDNLTVLPQSTHNKELSPLVGALNQLILNMKAQLVKERTFLDTCTHELRTPITAMVAQIQALEHTDVALKQRLHKIHLSALRTVRVAYQFLSLARNSNAQALGHDYREFDFCELIRETTINTLHNYHNIDYQILGEKKLLIYADPLSIEVMCRNLIESVVKYAVASDTNVEQNTAEVLLSIHKNNDDLIFTIEDSGPGVDAAHRSHLLERFYRVPGQQASGAGLGLSIVKEVAGLYQGGVVLDKSQTLGGFKVIVKLSFAALSTSTNKPLVAKPALPKYILDSRKVIWG